MAPEESKSPGIREVAGVVTGGGTFILDEMFTSTQIFPRGHFPSTFTSFSLLTVGNHSHFET